MSEPARAGAQRAAAGSAAAQAAHALSRRPFEPETAPADAGARQRATRFADRELGLLAEQGNFERARILLARRAAAGDATTDLYLDAIRLERSAAPAGAAWQAWASRALAGAVEVAGALPLLVPERELCAYLVEQGIGWPLLGRQRDAIAARALLRLRLERLLRDEPAGALASVQDPALVEAAKADHALRVLVLGVLAATLWSDPPRAAAVARAYGVGADAPAGGVDASTAASATEQHARVLLADAARMQPAWHAATQAASCPAPLERCARIGPVAGRDELQRLALTLQNDLRAQPGAYLRSARALAGAGNGLGAWLTSALDDARAMLGPARVAAVHDAERLLMPVRHTPEHVRVRRLWLAAPLPAAAVLAASWPAAGAVRFAGMLCSVLLLVVLRHRLDAWLYGRRLRPALAEAIAVHDATLASLCTQLRARGFTRGRALAAHAERDASLAIVAALAAFARSSASAERTSA